MTDDEPRTHYVNTPEITKFFDALEAANVGSQTDRYPHGFFDRPCGVVDAHGPEIVAALLAAGWRPPE